MEKRRVGISKGGLDESRIKYTGLGWVGTSKTWFKKQKWKRKNVELGLVK